MNMNKNLITVKNTRLRHRRKIHEHKTEKYEVTINKCTNVRIGIANKKANSFLPLGADEYSYAFSNQGYIFHNSVRYVYGESFTVNDIIGVEYTRHYLKFYKNGNDLGVAFWNIQPECFPGYSLYGDCEVMFNYSDLLAYCKNHKDDLMCVWE